MANKYAERIKVLNTRLANNLIEKGVEITANETATVLINKTIEKIGQAEAEAEMTKGLISREISGDVIIPQGTTSIGDSAFRDCKSLTSITIPDSVAYIGLYAFYNSGIKNITLGLGVTVMRQDCLRGMANITELVIPNSVVKMETRAIYQMTSLTKIYLPNSLQEVESSNFNSCEKLKEIVLEQGFNCSLNISCSTLYSVETLVAILEALADLTGQGAKTLTIGATNLAKLTDEQIAIATDKNWTLA